MTAALLRGRHLPMITIISSRRGRVLVGVSTLVFFTGGSIAAQATAASGSTARVYHLSDSGRTVHASKGATFRVSLIAATDGGFSWDFSRRTNAAVVKYSGRKGYSLAPSPQTTPPTVGAPTRQVFTFHAVGDGTTLFKLGEYPPGPRGQKAERSFSLTVKVS